VIRSAGYPRLRRWTWTGVRTQKDGLLEVDCTATVFGYHAIGLICRNFADNPIPNIAAHELDIAQFWITPSTTACGLD
jgi:hypothetical protein